MRNFIGLETRYNRGRETERQGGREAPGPSCHRARTWQRQTHQPVKSSNVRSHLV